MSDKLESNFYEVLDEIQEEYNPECTLLAAFTPNNGIRIRLEDEDNYVEFDFTDRQAELIGQALVRWSQRRRTGEPPRANEEDQ